MERKWEIPDDFSKPWMGFRSQEEQLREEAFWADLMLPSRRRKHQMTQLQRNSQAKMLKQLRRERYQEMRDGSDGSACSSEN